MKKLVSYRQLFSMFILLGMANIGFSQTVFQPKQLDNRLRGFIYDNETIYEIRPHLNGFALGYKKGKIVSYDKTVYRNYEIGFTKHPDERRQNKNTTISGFRISSPFVYGKRNEMFNLRGSTGVKKYLSEKTKQKGVAMGYIYEGGVALSLLKPYELKVVRIGDDNLTRTQEVVRFNNDTREDYLNFDRIYGGNGIFKGWDGLRPTVGLHAKIGMHWAVGAYERQAKAIEAGIMVDIYPGKVPIMVESENVKNQFLFIKLYASGQIGSRKLRSEMLK